MSATTASLAGGFSLRPYQIESINALRSNVAAGVKAQVLQLATGGGKTQIASSIAQSAVAKGNRVFFIVDSIELVDQALGRFEADGMRCGVIQGQHFLTDYSKQVQVGTIQTLRSRWEYMPDDLKPGVLIVDECHVMHQAHEQIIRECKHKGIPVIGLSATPFRKGMGQVFDELVVGATTASLTEQGYLVPAVCYAPFVPELKGVKTTTGGDWQADALGELMGDAKIVGDVVDNWLKLAEGRQTIVFAANVGHSRLLCDAFQARGIRAAHIDGYERDPEVREQVISGFRAGNITVLTNCMILCLDEQTEILTADGWKGIDAFADDDCVANWHKDGSIDFLPPRQVFRRLREPGERMVSLRTHGADFRVTEGHNMVVASGSGRKSWKDVPAIELEDKRFSWPRHGMAAPSIIEEDEADEKRQKARIRSLAYVYRKRGAAPDDARRMAEEHVSHKAQPSIRPADLSLDQCRFIGFWLADGTVANGNNGGVVYSATQSKRYANIVEWFDGVLARAGIRATKYDRGGHFTWTFVQGTGGQGQRKPGGIFRLAAYLDKSGSRLLWGLDREQLIALLEGFWYGDGLHGQIAFEQAEARKHAVRGTQRALYDLLQAVCVCRGIAASVKPVKRGTRWLDRWSDQFTFSFCLSKAKGGNSRVRPVVDDGIEGERVWCVETDSGYIVTRRNGIAMVMGNCKGFDSPETSCVVLARPTKSLMLHIQAIGRGLRIAPGKRDCIVIDHAGNVLRNGLPTDDLPAELDDGKIDRNLDRKKREEREPIPAACASCGHVSTQHKCPVCGFAPQSRKDVEVIDGELYEVKSGQTKQIAPDELERLYAELLGYAQQCGFRSGWAWHKCREFAGRAPRDNNSIDPVEPSQGTLNVIKHLNIKSAKRRVA